MEDRAANQRKRGTSDSSRKGSVNKLLMAALVTAGLVTPALSQVTGGATPLARVDVYFSDEDYPASAVRGGESGTTGFRLEIGPNGRVTSCTVTSSSGSSALDSTTCRLLKSRLRGKPAIYFGKRKWSLPED